MESNMSHQEKEDIDDTSRRFLEMKDVSINPDIEKGEISLDLLDNSF